MYYYTKINKYVLSSCDLLSHALGADQTKIIKPSPWNQKYSLIWEHRGNPYSMLSAKKTELYPCNSPNLLLSFSVHDTMIYPFLRSKNKNKKTWLSLLFSCIPYI